MGVFQKRGKYYIDYYLEGRRVRECIGTSKREADRALAVRRGEILQGRLKLADHLPSPRFSEFAVDYLEYSKANKRSWRRDAVTLKQLTPFFGTRRLKEITPWLVERYKVHRKAQIKPASVNLELACLKHMFTMAMTWGKAERNPVKQVRLLRLSNQVERILSAEEEQRLLGCSSDRLRPLITLALNTGMRLGEIVRLDWERIDWQRGVIRLVETKNGRGRAIPMNATVRAALQPLRGDGIPSGPVFGAERTVAAWQRHDFDRARAAAELADVRFHDLRHTFATRLVLSGVDLATVAKLLGHSTVMMTMRYAHPAPEDLRSAVAAIEGKELSRNAANVAPIRKGR
jgi:integrase